MTLPSLADIAAAERTRRAKRNAQRVQQGEWASDQALADAAIWTAIAQWSLGNALIPPACGWEPAARAAIATAAAAMKRHDSVPADLAHARTTGGLVTLARTLTVKAEVWGRVKGIHQTYLAAFAASDSKRIAA